jgi:prepilin-type N-terminal cleavage/methylation domain-containing protein
MRFTIHNSHLTINSFLLTVKCQLSTVTQRGFTFIELLLVITLLLILGTMGTAFTARFLTQNAVDNTTDQFTNSLRKAQLNAMMGKQNSNWGVNYTSNTITLYRGNSYATRTIGFDERYTVNAGVTVTGISDINFTRVTGLPGSTPTITISGSGSNNSITINSQGVINR